MIVIMMILQTIQHIYKQSVKKLLESGSAFCYHSCRLFDQITYCIGFASGD